MHIIQIQLHITIVSLPKRFFMMCTSLFEYAAGLIEAIITYFPYLVNG